MTTRDPVLALTTRLKSLADVTAIVSTRVYRRGDVPTNPVLPYIIVYEVTDNGDACTNTTNEAHMRAQCSCFASTDIAASTLSQTLKAAVPVVNVTLAAGAGYVPVVGIEEAGGTPDENADISLFTYHRDFRIHYAY